MGESNVLVCLDKALCPPSPWAVLGIQGQCKGETRVGKARPSQTGSLIHLVNHLQHPMLGSSCPEVEEPYLGHRLLGEVSAGRKAES